jgi:hypothetical protein
MSYSERATQIVNDSSISVFVLLNHDATSTEFWPLCPAAQSEVTGPQEFTARRLRSVGVVGLAGTQPMCAFKEPLDTRVVEAIGDAFVAYIRALLGESFIAQWGEQLNSHAGDFVQFANALLSLPDTRPE